MVLKKAYFFKNRKDLGANFNPSKEFKIIGKEILGENFITFLKKYKNEKLFIGTTKGFGILDLELFYNNKQTEAITFFDKYHGFQGLSCEQNSIWIDKKGKTWIGTEDGVLEFDIEKYFEDTIPPKVSIRSVSSLTKTYYPEDFDEIYFDENEVININLKYEINPNLYNNIWIKYRLHPDSIFRYSYSPNTIELKDVKIGQYNVEIIAEKNGLASPPLNIHFQKKEPFYKNLKFIFSAIVIVGLLAFLITKWFQKRKLEKDKLKIEAIVNQLNPHFINNVLYSIQIRAAKTNDEQLVSMVNKLARNIGLVFRNSKESKPYHSLAEELELISNYLDIQKMRYGNRVQIEMPKKEIIEKWQHLNVPLMILQIHAENAVERGIRNLPEGETGTVRVEIYETKTYLQLVVEDSGVGRRKAQSMGSKGTERGTKMIREMIRIYNQINFQKMSQYYEDDIFEKPNGQKHGTRVIILIPKKYSYVL